MKVNFGVMIETSDWNLVASEALGGRRYEDTKNLILNKTTSLTFTLPLDVRMDTLHFTPVITLLKSWFLTSKIIWNENGYFYESYIYLDQYHKLRTYCSH